MTQPAHMWKAWCLLFMAALWSPAGWAQQAGGNGIKVGEGRLHPSFAFEARVDSAVGYFAVPDSTDSQLAGEALLHFRPGLRLELPSSRVNLLLQGSLDYVRYTGLLTPETGNLSRLEGKADLRVRVNQERPVEVEVGNHFERSERTRSAAVGVGVLSLFNELRLGVPLRPGSGVLTLTPQVAWAVERFQPRGSHRPVDCDEDSCDPLVVDRFDYDNLRAGLQGRWRFLPKTAVLVDAHLDTRRYEEGSTPATRMLRTSVGLAGLVSPKVALTTTVGWSRELGGSGTSALTAHLEGSYLMSETSTFKAGYLRSLEPVPAFGLLRDERLYMEGRQTLHGERLTLRGSAAFDSLEFQDAANPRRDTVFHLDLGPEYLLSRWLTGGVGYLLGVRSSTSPGGGINYTRHEGYLRLTVTY